jgi:hypothetical protein
MMPEQGGPTASLNSEKWLRNRFRFRRWLWIVLILVAAIGWLSRNYFASPSIRFVEFRNSPNGHVAVFQITNQTKTPYSFTTFLGFDPPVNRLVRREIDGVEIGGFSGGVADRTLLPGASVEIGIIDPPMERFRIFLRFIRGTNPHAFTMSDRIGVFLRRVTGNISAGNSIRRAELTWSDHAPGLPACAE